MKTKTLSILASVSVPLILTGTSDAGFVGIETTSKPNDFGLLVVNVYAIFDRPGQDFMRFVVGTENAPLLIQVIGGTFYNSPNSSGDFAPTTILISMFPSLAYDTFVTIGVKVVGTVPGSQPQDHTFTTAGFPDGITGSVLETNASAWGIHALAAQGDPFDPDYVQGNGSVLIGQFSTSNGTAISGTFLLFYTSNGVQFQTSVESFFHVPGPGALALLGAAGLIGRRRRR